MNSKLKYVDFLRHGLFYTRKKGTLDYCSFSFCCWSTVTQSVYRLGYGLSNQGSIPNMGSDGSFSLHHHVQNGSKAHPATYPMVSRACYPRDKVARVWSWPTCLHLMSRLRSRAISPLTHCLHGVALNWARDTSSWSGTYLSTGPTLPSVADKNK